MFIKTLKVRIKDKHAKTLDAMACECNLVWNFVNELSYKHLKRTGQFFTAYDIAKYTAGATKCGLTIHSQTVQEVTEEYVRRRYQFQKAKLRWRTSYGSRKSLGWIPFKTGAVTYVNGQLRYAGKFFSLWDSYGLADYGLRAGNFSQDGRGRWYANVCVEVALQECSHTTHVGIDLGLKTFAALSTGEKIRAPRLYHDTEDALKSAQRARKRRLVKSLHARTANRRNDFLHKLSTRLVQSNSAIFVGDVNPTALVKTKMAKSVSDAGWSKFRTMLSYKCDCAGVLFEEVNEKYTSQTCSTCGNLPESWPTGIAGLGIREWTCKICGDVHDRDVNAAKNILRRGRATLVAGTNRTHTARDVKSPLL